MIIGVTNESQALVDKWYAKRKPTYPIVILKNKSFENALGVKFFPTAGVMDPAGELIYSGSAGGKNGPLAKAMAKAKKGSVFPKVFAKTTKLLTQEKYAESYASLLVLIDKGKLKEDERPVAKSLRAYLEGLATSSIERAKAEVKGGLVYRAVRIAEPFAKADPAFPATPQVAAYLEELSALPEFDRELDGGSAYEKALALSDEGDYFAAVKAYKKVLKKYEGTKLADRAHKDAMDLLRAGKPGYKATCPSCRKGKRACKKHKKDVKLD